MTLNIEQERREFHDWFFSDETALKKEPPYSATESFMFNAWLAAKRAAVGSAEPVAFAFVIVDKNGNPEFVTSTHDEAQEHINDAISEHNIHGAGKWRAIPAYEMRPSDDKLWDQALRERDYNAEIADKLADAISQYFGEEIGEHSSANCPWLESLRVIEEAAPPAPVSATVNGVDEVEWLKTGLRNYQEKLAAVVAEYEAYQKEHPAPVSAEPVDASDDAAKGNISAWLRRRAGGDLVMIPGRLAGQIADHIDKLASALPFTDAKDSERFDWYFRPDRVKCTDFMKQYFKGMKERWTPDQWRAAIDAAIAAKEAGK